MWYTACRATLLALALVGFVTASTAATITGELRLHEPAACTGLFDSLEPDAFGSFDLDLEVGGPGTVSFSIPDGTLTAEWVRDNGVRGVDPSTGDPVDPPTINPNAFDAYCALFRGYTTLDPTACGLDIFNSQKLSVPTNPSSPTIAVAFSNSFSGQDPDAAAAITGGGFFLSLTGLTSAGQEQVRSATVDNPFAAGVKTPLVSLVLDPNDGPAAVHPDPIQNIFTPYGLSPTLTDEQEALLGCGPFYGTNCDIDGVGLMRSELSALLQSWPLSEGEPVCTRYEESMTSILPGCRGPGDPGYDIDADGSAFGDDLFGLPEEYQRVHPLTGEEWASELAIFSWNYLQLAVALSFAADPANVLTSEFDPDDPLRVDGCSFANPLDCCTVAGALMATTRAPEEDASQPPLRHWLWEAGAEYLVTNATGDLEDFLGWTLFAFGPEQSREGGAEVGVAFFLSPPDPLPPMPVSPFIVSHSGPDGLHGTADDNFAGVAYGMATTPTTTTATTTTASPYPPPCMIDELVIDPDNTVDALAPTAPTRVPFRVDSPTGGLWDGELDDGGAGGTFDDSLPFYSISQPGGTFEFTYTPPATPPPSIVLRVRLYPHSLGFSCDYGSTVGDHSKEFTVATTATTTTTTSTTTTTLPPQPPTDDRAMCKIKIRDDVPAEKTRLVKLDKVQKSLDKGLTLGECANPQNGQVLCKSKPARPGKPEKRANVLLPESQVQKALDKGFYTLGECE